MSEWDNAKIRALLRLSERSKDIGDGWRQCTARTIEFFDGFPPELMEKDTATNRVRMTSEGAAVLKYSGEGG